MSTIIGSFGYVEPVLNVTLCDLQSDGTTLNIDYKFDYKSTYEIMSFNPVDGMLYTNKGKLNSFGSDPMRCKCDHEHHGIDWLVLDCSTANKSKMIRLFIKDFRSIKKIEDLI